MNWLHKSTIYAAALISFSAFSSGKDTSGIPTSDSSDFEKGQHLFRTAGGYGCSTCHGLFAQGGGNAGGNIRGKGLDALNLILEKEPTMKLLGPTLTTEDRRLLSIYVGELGTLNLVEWTIEKEEVLQNGEFVANTDNQLVILNKTFEPVELNLLGFINRNTVSINPYETKAFKWNPDGNALDLKPSNYELRVQTINELK
ncbi:hypothetical protein [Vibrio sp. VB16]|uniref:hypothetical protein n=1 Tax=Vibrio sp. VB16 TaxID=2785746 RepID=UPI00189C7556|nr:hypothetical protein [Vibrio sp. VB16]UGA56541.1 hypothetical protein IUZ65_020275 [Vibrio sp. VB16]